MHRTSGSDHFRGLMASIINVHSTGNQEAGRCTGCITCSTHHTSTSLHVNGSKLLWSFFRKANEFSRSNNLHGSPATREGSVTNIKPSIKITVFKEIVWNDSKFSNLADSSWLLHCCFRTSRCFLSDPLSFEWTISVY